MFLWLLYIYKTYCSRNILVPAWERIASAPGPSCGNSLLASSPQERTGHFPELQPPSQEHLSRYSSFQASDAQSHGWGLRGSLRTPFSLLVHPAEPETRRRVQSSGADSAQSISVSPSPSKIAPLTCFTIYFIETYEYKSQFEALKV